jgi:GNAT superfamily N-acetyltransferase
LATERAFHPAFHIEEVQDLDAAWADLEPLIEGIIEYHRPWDARVLLEDWSPRIRAVMVPGPDTLVLLARDDGGNAVAFLHAVMLRDGGIFDHVVGMVENIFIAESSRGSGIGTAFMEHFEAWAKAEGAIEYRLHVNAGNELGQRFWNREGYQPAEYVMRKPVETQP